MQRFYATLCLILLLTSVWAQDLVQSRRSSYFTHIYKISNDQAESLYKDIWDLDTTYLANLFDSFPTDSSYNKLLPVGHYVFIKTVSSNLDCELRSVNNLSISLLNNHRDLIMVFNDSLGHELQDVKVAVRSRKVPFDNDIHAFRLKKSNQRGLVSAAYGGHVSYFEIERGFNNGFFVRTAKKLSRTFPINHIISPIFYLHDNVRRILWGGGIVAPGIYYRISRIFQPKQRTGYIALNKPKFRPDDTVRLKAVITTRKGRPIDKKIDIFLERYYPEVYSKKVGSVAPFRKGAYQFEFKLVDSLKLRLDDNYTIRLRDRKGNELLSREFDYEDYELSQNTYSLRSEQRIKRYPSVLYLRGEDSNAMPLFDVRAEVLLKPTHVEKYYEHKVFVPDTLWFYETRLEAAGETKISIPDSVMPPVSLKYEAVVSFFNAENERTIKTLELEYDTRPFPITIEVVDDSVKITNLDTQNAITDAVTLSWSDKGAHIVEKRITLPYAERINPSALSYAVSHLTNGSMTTEEIALDELPDQLQILAHRTADSLVIATDNPRKIPFRYFLFRNRSLIGSGNTDSFFLERKAKASDSHSLSVQYVWAGKSETREYKIDFDKRNLNIILDHPEIIYPGQKASFKITVKDAFGAPVEDVDLTALAITKKFENPSVPSVPSFSKPAPRRAIFNEFHETESQTTLSRKMKWTYWRKTLALDSIAFYKFLFPESGYFEHRVQAEVTQFSPFVVNGGSIIPAEVIYVDGQPVYYAGVSTIEPYSFHITPGEHTVDLRLYNSLITIRNVRVQAGQKVIFSIDRIRLPQNCSETDMPFRLSDEELKKLGRYFMVLRSQSELADAYLAQGNTYRLLGDQHNVYGYSPREQLAGPFYPGEITYTERDGFQQTFNYEPFSSYEFQQNLLKVRDADINKYMDKSFSWNFGIPPFDQGVQTSATIREHWKQVDESTAFSFDRFPDFEPAANNVGKLTLDKFPEKAKDLPLRAVFVVDLNDPDNYSIFSKNLSNTPLLPGTYQAVLIFSNEQYLQVDSVHINPHGNNYYNLESYVLQEPDTFSIHILKTIRKWSTEGTYATRERQRELQGARQFLYQQSSTQYYFDHTVTGRIVSSSDGIGLPGVNVIVKGTRIGTVTNLDGYYSINCPSNATLVFSFIGFATEEVPVSSRASIDVTMQEDIQQLSEVVVVGMGTQTQRGLTAVVSMQLSGRLQGVVAARYTNDLQEAVSLAVRGVSGISSGEEPLVILDGRIVRLQEVDKNRVTAIDILKGAEATALFGSRASNGVILLSTQPGATKNDLKEFSKSFITAAALENTPGNALRRNFRDYAFWKPALKTNAEGKAEFKAVFPDDITGWDAHVLGIGGRRSGQASSAIRSYKPLLAQLAQPHFLIEGDSSTAIGKITNYLQEEITLERTIRINESEIGSATVDVKDSKIDSIQLKANARDTLAVYYSLSYNDYSDGELRKIPVYRRGTRESTGEFIALHADTTITLTFDPHHGDIKLYAQTDLLDAMIDELRFLKNYAYDCNEQLASRLRGLLLEKRIAAYKDEKFQSEGELRRVVRKLVGNQNKDGSWSWWETGEGSVWITVHVAGALDMAEKEGFPIAVDKESLINYLELNLANLASHNRLHVQEYLLRQGEKLHVSKLADSLRQSDEASLHDKLLAQRVMQLAGHTPDWKWINTHKSQTIKGNPYWGEERLHLFDNSVLNTLVVYRIIEKENPKSDELGKITSYLLEQRKRHWRNTYESSLILETILPRLLTNSQQKSKPVLQLSGLTTERVVKFPFEKTVTGTTPLTISKSGQFPIYFTAYRETWNADPSRAEGDFVVSAAFDGGSQNLNAGKPVNLIVEVEVKKDAEYVMIEVPIPAGCSYASKLRSRANGEVHREYYSHKTNIYSEYLKKGTYTYTIPLLPRYSGTYTLNPAVVQCMYFPVIYGREGVKRVTVSAP